MRRVESNEVARERRVVRIGRVLAHGFVALSLLVTVATVVLIIVAVGFVFLTDS